MFMFRSVYARIVKGRVWGLGLGVRRLLTRVVDAE